MPFFGRELKCRQSHLLFPLITIIDHCSVYWLVPGTDSSVIYIGRIVVSLSNQNQLAQTNIVLSVPWKSYLCYLYLDLHQRVFLLCMMNLKCLFLLLIIVNGLSLSQVCSFLLMLNTKL